MCGIVGFAGIHNPDLLRKMNNLLAYRGPDDSGEFIDKKQNVALAMRRLSIIDLDKGNQPMSNENESLWVVCNGEIYNSPDLRRKLVQKGHNFKTKNSDTEALLHLYEKKDKDMLKDLNGMFAFVIYDKKKNILFGARDRIGIKPLYYTHKNGKFAFASELKSLLLLPWVSRDIDSTSLYHYLSLQFVPAPDSIFSDIKKLPAGYYFIYNLDKNQLDIKKYWALDVQRTEIKTCEEWISLTQEKLKEVVKRWILSDVPVACSLSGGLDSSSIVALLAKSGVSKLKTYTLGFTAYDEQRYNELSLARKVAKKWGTEHHEVILNSTRVLDDLWRMVWHLDEPYGGGLPSWYIYEVIGKDVKVAITGTGGDELFGNYGKYIIYEKGIWFRWLKSFKQDHWQFPFCKIRNGLSFPKGHFYHRYFSDAVKDKILFNQNNHNPKIKTEAYLEQLWGESQVSDPRNAVAYVDFQLQLPEEFLLVTDRFSMAHSVEARVPFLDHTLAELAFRIPAQMRTRSNDPKYLLKQVVKEVLPKELLGAAKRGFVLPLDVWIKKDLRPLIEELLCPNYLKRQGIFSPFLYQRIVKPHLQERADNTQQVWTVLMFQLWHHVFIGEKATPGNYA